MESLFVRYKNALVLMLVLLAQVVLLAMQVRRPAPDMPDGHNVRLWRYMVTSVVTPPARLAHGIGQSVRGAWNNYLDLRHVRERNLSLQAENDRLRLEQVSLAQDALEGQRLREMLDFRGRYIDKTVAAQVIGTSGTDQAKVILIDRGSKDGLQVQMPVITPDGIVGKIKNVFPHSAQVLLISDQTSGTGVVLETTRVRGVMKGNASGQPQMINISPDDRIKAGEPLMTSGGDQVYPPGMPVGVVERVVADPDTSYVNVVIKPNANLAALEEVMVVTEFSDKMPFAQSKDMLQSEVVALAEKQRAADILSEKLPSLREEKAQQSSPGITQDVATAGGGDPARPMRPPAALHPDRYTPGAAPLAETLTPGAAPPISHRTASTPSSVTATESAAKPTTSGVTTASGSGSGTAIVSRFPAKLVAAPPTGSAATAPATAGAPAGTTSTTGTASTATKGTIPGAVRTTPITQPGQGVTVRSSTGQAVAGQATLGQTAVGQRVVNPTGAGQTRTSTTGTGQTNTGQAGTGQRSIGQSSTGQAGVRSPVRAGQAISGASTPGQTPPTGAGPSGTGRATSAQTPAGGAPQSAPVRRVPSNVDSDSGGILTPAGMGAVGAAPRPRVTAPGGTGANGSTQTNPSAKPATPKPQTQRPPSQSAPAATPPGGR